MKAVSRLIGIYIVPGAVYQSIAIGGGYGTGREIVEYFTGYGIAGGTLGMLVSTACMAVVIAVSFELARSFGVYDYRSYMALLIGPASVLYEVLAITMLLIVLAVVGVAAGNILQQTFDIPIWMGTLAMFVLVVTLNFLGRRAITRVLTLWSAFLYAVFIAYFVVTLTRFGNVPGDASEIRSGWATSGLKYALYNLAAIPVMLYAVRDIETRKQALVSGALAALIAMTPGLLFHLSYLPAYPEVLGEPIPTYWMIERLSVHPLMVLYVVVLFGTFIETCSGSMQGVNERLDHWAMRRRGRGLSRPMHAMTAGAAILISGSLSTFGIVALVAQGYGTIAWGFFAVYVVPTLTIGVYKLVRHRMVATAPGRPRMSEPDV